jgi:uncharacterized iron-regulated membrane protein
LIVLPLLLAQALTGVSLAFPQTVRSLFLPSGSRNAKTKKLPDAGKAPHRNLKSRLLQQDLSEALLVASKAMSDGSLREIRFPDQPGQGLEFRFWRNGDLQESGNNAIALNADGTKATAIGRFAGQSRREKFLLAFKPLHYGELGGLAHRALLAALGLCLAALCITGILIFATPKWRSWRKSRGMVDAKLSPSVGGTLAAR